MKPTFEEIRQQAYSTSHRSVPHSIKLHNGSEEYYCLSADEPRDDHIEENGIHSAVMFAALEAGLAAYYQLGLKRDDVWDKFCDISFSAP